MSGLSLAVQVGGAVGMRRRLLLAAAAISLAVAIWSMHFVGMLAARLPFPVDYLVFPDAAVLPGLRHRGRRRRLAASVGQLTAGAAGGRRGLHGRRHRHHALHRHDRRSMPAPIWSMTPLLVVASVAVAIAASGLALWLAGGRGGRPPLLLSASGARLRHRRHALHGHGRA